MRGRSHLPTVTLCACFVWGKPIGPKLVNIVLSFRGRRNRAARLRQHLLESALSPTTMADMTAKKTSQALASTAQAESVVPLDSSSTQPPSKSSTSKRGVSLPAKKTSTKTSGSKSKSGSKSASPVKKSKAVSPLRKSETKSKHKLRQHDPHHKTTPVLQAEKPTQQPPAKILASPVANPPVSLTSSDDDGDDSSSMDSRVSAATKARPLAHQAPSRHEPPEVVSAPQLTEPPVPLQVEHDPLCHLTGQQLISFDREQLAYLYGLPLSTQDPVRVLPRHSPRWCSATVYHHQ